MLWLCAVALIALGLLGSVMPGLPGAIFVFTGMCLGASADGFSRVSVGTIVVLGVLTAGSYAVEFVAIALGVKRLGASRRAVVGAALGTMLGIFFGLPGVIIGPFAGAAIGELSARSDLARAGRVGMAAWIGFFVGTVLKAGIAFIMLGVFLIALFVP
jgi:uncharacterized protein YqgC (DUF456 family)